MDMEKTNTDFTKEQMNALYPEGSDRYYWNIARNGVIIDVLKRMHLSREAMLEIGCGRGVVLTALRASGFACTGVDLSTANTNEAYIQYGKNFTELDATLLSSIEIVLAFDVIEHIDDDGTFLRSIRETFPNLKYCIITVPAREEIWSNFDTFNGHFRRYRMASLKKVVTESGFSIRYASYFFHMLYIPARIFSLFNIVRKTTVTPPRVGFVSFIHRLIAKCLLFEYRVLPSQLPGTSIIMVLENK